MSSPVLDKADRMVTGACAHAGVPRQQSWLVFALGPYVMCASALDVEGIVTRPQAIARVPLAPDYALGAFLFRGSTAAAINLRKKLRLPEREHPEASPFVVSRIADAIVAFSVDEVRDVLEENDLEWRSLPSSLAGGLFDRLAIRGRTLILQTSFAALRDIDVELAPVAAWLPPDKEGETRVRAALEDKTAGKGEAKTAPSEAVSAQALSGGLGHGTEDSSTRIALPATAGRRHHASGARPFSSRGRRKIPVRTAIAASLPSQHSPTIEGRRIGLADATDGNRSGYSGADETLPPAPSRAPRRVVLTSICAIATVAALYWALPGPSGRGMLGPTRTPASRLSFGPSVSASKPALPEPRESIVQDRVAPPGTALTLSDGRSDVAATGRTHTVVAGETLWGIAKKEAGDPFRYPALAKLSDIANPDLIRPGEIVRIP